MDISKRLQMIANCVPTNTDTVADIGTDHGYIPIYLIKNNIAKRCLACDINPMPLSSAQKNINYYDMQAQIETRLGSGLSKVSPNEVDIVMIAGMGGMLIIDILREDLEVVKDIGLLILQPQLDVGPLRKYIHAIDFSIIDEKMLCEDGKYYTIITAKPGKETNYSHEEYLLGKKLIQSKNPVLKDFLNYKINSFNLLIHNLSSKNTTEAQKRLEEVKKECNTYKEVLKCL